MAAKRKQASAGVGAEWIGGTIAVPAYVTGEGEPYRPEVLLWMSGDGLVMGTATEKPGDVLAIAADHLRATIKRPMVGPPRAPSRVRVDSPDLARALREVHSPAIEIVCAPTPELEVMAESMRQHMRKGENDDSADDEQTFLSPGVGPEDVAASFSAFARLYRAQPWSVVPGDRLLSLTIDGLGVRDAVFVVVGQMGESFGVLLFPSLHEYDLFLEGADAMERGAEHVGLPQFLSLNFERGADLEPDLRREIAKHAWEVAGPNAYPCLMFTDEDGVCRSATREELAIAEALSLGLAHICAEKRALQTAAEMGAPFVRTVSVPAHAGEIEVRLALLDEEEPTDDDLPDDVLAALAQLDEQYAAGHDDEGDEEYRGDLERTLLCDFDEAPESADLAEICWLPMLMDFANDFLDCTIASVDASGLRELLFDVIPRKAAIDAQSADAIVAECRAFYAFAKREYAFELADGCLRLLDGGAVTKLAASLSDRRKFGMAKSIMVAGQERGFDVSTKEGVEAWMRQLEKEPLPPWVSLPSLPKAPADAKVARVKKDKRKSERKARKKNR